MKIDMVSGPDPGIDVDETMDVFHVGLQSGLLSDTLPAHMALKLRLLVALPLHVSPHRSAVLVLLVAGDADEPVVVPNKVVVQRSGSERHSEISV